jgi:uncharacterized membrane protein YgcG
MSRELDIHSRETGGDRRRRPVREAAVPACRRILQNACPLISFFPLNVRKIARLARALQSALQWKTEVRRMKSRLQEADHAKRRSRSWSLGSSHDRRSRFSVGGGSVGARGSHQRHHRRQPSV